MMTRMELDELKNAAQEMVRGWLEDFREAFEARPATTPVEIDEATMQRMMAQVMEQTNGVPE